MNNIPQMIQQLNINLHCYVPHVCPCAFTGTNSCSRRAGWWRICQVPPPYLGNEGFYRLFLLALQHCPTAACNSKDICYIWMHKQALMLVETTRSISLFADMWAWNNMTQSSLSLNSSLSLTRTLIEDKQFCIVRFLMENIKVLLCPTALWTCWKNDRLSKLSAMFFTWKQSKHDESF